MEGDEDVLGPGKRVSTGRLSVTALSMSSTSSVRLAWRLLLSTETEQIRGAQAIVSSNGTKLCVVGCANGSVFVFKLAESLYI